MIGRGLLTTLLLLPSARAYSVLTHEAIIDSAWEDALQPVLVRKFPNATAEQLRDARAFAYGGAIIQDLGYYPFGSRFFGDLVHYARGGDFIENLVADARDLNEYAFALGALAHDAADNYGHPIGINPTVPLLYPKLRARYGSMITYQDSPKAHLRVEFGFDVVQVANGNYAPQAYHDFIGFKVARPLLERVFRKTYSIDLEDQFLSFDLAIGTYRYTVSQLIPAMTKLAWQIKKDEIAAAPSGLTRQKFIYNLSRRSYENEWGREYKRPGCFTRLLATLFRVIPKVGPLRALAFRPPGPEAQKLFMESFNAALDRYRRQLAAVRAGEDLQIPNRNFDTGEPTRFGAYRRADETWEDLVKKLAKEKTGGLDRDLSTAVRQFYGGKSPQDPSAAAALAALLASDPGPRTTRQ